MDLFKFIAFTCSRTFTELVAMTVYCSVYACVRAPVCVVFFFKHS